MDKVEVNIWNSAQDGELDWHNKNPWRADNWDFIINTNKIFSFFGFCRDDFRGKSILDVGAGPRLRTRYFRDSEITAIEPLGYKFNGKFGWCDLYEVPLYSNPIEIFIPTLVNQFDLVISINALDHCYDFNSAISNISKYVKDDGVIFVSYDEHSGSDPMHPLGLSDEVSRSTFKNNNLNVVESLEYSSYGLGERSISYWLKK